MRKFTEKKIKKISKRKKNDLKLCLNRKIPNGSIESDL